jgi:lipopolysaccharide export system permease protein
MPTIIDRYLLRQFVQVLVICFSSFIGLYIVIDAFPHLDRFVDYAEKNGGLLATMASYYAYRAIMIFDRTSGVLTLVAVMFTVTWIQRHHEMTALLAAGITRARVLRPVLVAAIGVSLAAAANREVVMPTIRHKLALDSKNLGGEQEAQMQSRWDSQTEILIGGDRIVPSQLKIITPNFVLPRHFDKFGKRLSAREARYLPANGDRAPPDGWSSGYLLSGVTEPKALLKQPSLLLDGKPVIITPIGNDWLQDDQLFIVSGVSFEFLSAGATWRDFASTREMIHELRSPSTDIGADVRVAIHTRFLQPFLDTTLLFLGLPFVITRTNRNPFIAIGLCLVVVTIFMLVVLGCQSLGWKGWLTAPQAAWLPLIIFAPVAAAMSGSLQQ